MTGTEKKKETKTIDFTRGCYGPKLKSSEVKQWLIDSIHENLKRKEGRFTLNLWGPPGVGKTSLVKFLENEKVEFDGKEFDGIKIVDIPIAQVEEMGDILGLPETFIEMEHESGNKKWFMKSFVDDMIKAGWVPTDRMPVTRYAPPSWVPTEECPGIILFDDGNRASQRIMKGIMQLVQDYRTISWEIPKGWTIVFTGNPDNRWNQVTSMDNAQLTRMKHVTFDIDAKEWAKWAIENNLDARGINFVLKYPEMMIGKERTNPRTLTEFFRLLKNYPKIDSSNRMLVYRDANSLLDEETVESMIVFFLRDVELVIDPEMILTDSDNAKRELEKLMKGKEPRIDIVNVVNDRLLAHICSSAYKFDKAHAPHVQAWLLDKNLPRDCSYGFIRNMLLGGSSDLKKLIVGNPAILKMVEESINKSK